MASTNSMPWSSVSPPRKRHILIPRLGSHWKLHKRFVLCFLKFFIAATDKVFQALQDSGIDYRGSNTGVFFGNLLTTVDELDDERYEVNNYNGVGRCVSIRANRISFTFDLRGPSLTVDTGAFSTSIPNIPEYTLSILVNSLLGIGNCDAPRALLN